MEKQHKTTTERTGGKNPRQALSRLELRLGRTAHGGTETFLELVDATFSVHKLLLTGEERMRIRGDTHGDHEMLHTIDRFLAVRGFGGACYHAGSSGHIDEDHGIVIGMKIIFHKYKVHAVPTRGVGIVGIR